jgi:hypothetical protein
MTVELLCFFMSENCMLFLLVVAVWVTEGNICGQKYKKCTKFAEQCIM